MAEGTQGLRELSDQSASLKLADGRALGYRCYGSEDGVPAFYFHGFPGSGLEAGFAETPGLRLIAIDRPGYGLSDPKPGRSLADCPSDVAALADSLGLARFAVLGISAGAPYALACAWMLKDRITATALVSGLGPPTAPGMNQGPARMLLRAGRNRLVFMPLAALSRHMLLARKGRERFRVFRRRMTDRYAKDAPKEQAVASEALADHLYESWREGMRRSISGVISDARIFASPWPFALAEIETPIHLWHGALDHIVPVDVGYNYALELPCVTSHIEGSEGHFSTILNGLPEIVRTLIDASTP